MHILLDTSAYSAARRGHSGAVAAILRAGRIAVTPIVLGELSAGFRRGTRRIENEQALGSFLQSPRVAVLPMTRRTAEHYAELHAELRRAGRPVPANDLWIAASANEFGLVILALDRHFAVIPGVRSEVLPA